MNLKKHTDSHGNYYELNEIKNSLTTIFIHGVGLDNTMWYPQKKYFHDQSILFYDLLNHGQSSGGFTDLSFDIYSNQLLHLINELQLDKINIVGFSIGALIAQHFTEKFYNKVNKLVGQNLNEDKLTLKRLQLEHEAEIGRIKYVAEVIYGQEESMNYLDNAVRWVIYALIFVFDPLAVLLLVSSTGLIARRVEQEKPKVVENRYGNQLPKNKVPKVEKTK